jgi:hypothetical protein
LVYGLFGIGGVIVIPIRDTGMSALGILVSELTDGSGLLLGAWCFVSYLCYRTPWAQERPSHEDRV